MSLLTYDWRPTNTDFVTSLVQSSARNQMEASQQRGSAAWDLAKEMQRRAEVQQRQDFEREQEERLIRHFQMTKDFEEAKRLEEMEKWKIENVPGYPIPPSMGGGRPSPTTGVPMTGDGSGLPAGDIDAVPGAGGGAAPEIVSKLAPDPSAAAQLLGSFAAPGMALSNIDKNMVPVVPVSTPVAPSPSAAATLMGSMAAPGAAAAGLKASMAPIVPVAPAPSAAAPAGEILPVGPVPGQVKGESPGQALARLQADLEASGTMSRKQIGSIVSAVGDDVVKGKLGLYGTRGGAARGPKFVKSGNDWYRVSPETGHLELDLRGEAKIRGTYRGSDGAVYTQDEFGKFDPPLPPDTEIERIGTDTPKKVKEVWQDPDGGQYLLYTDGTRDREIPAGVKVQKVGTQTEKKVKNTWQDKDGKPYTQFTDGTYDANGRPPEGAKLYTIGAEPRAVEMVIGSDGERYTRFSDGSWDKEPPKGVSLTHVATPPRTISEVEKMNALVRQEKQWASEAVTLEKQLGDVVKFPRPHWPWAANGKYFKYTGEGVEPEIIDKATFDRLHASEQKKADKRQEKEDLVAEYRRRATDARAQVSQIDLNGGTQVPAPAAPAPVAPAPVAPAPAPAGFQPPQRIPSRPTGAPPAKKLIPLTPEVRADAEAAIKRTRNRTAVLERLIENGYDPAGL